MKRDHRKRRQIAYSIAAVCAIAAGALLTSASLQAAPPTTKKPSNSKMTGNLGQKALTEDEKIVHVLNRLGYGPRPGDVEKVRAMGLQRYIDLQLTPEKIDDSALEQKLAGYTQLQLSPEQLGELYHAMLTSSKEAQAMRKQQQKSKPGADPADPAKPQDPAAAAKARREMLLAMTPEERRKMQETRQAMVNSANPMEQAHEQFMAAKVIRAVESERQLQEVLADFWSNHFNIDLRKPPCGVLKIVDERDAIRPHLLGKFRDLLEASAKSPAMLVYLDNYQSTADVADMPQALGRAARRAKALAAAGQPAVPPKKKRAVTGLNENYAREIMELHTLGVDGGYTQNDVREVARCFTGWSIAYGDAKRPGKGKNADAGVFHFYPALHDNGEKHVLGQVIPAGGGQQDAEKVLGILASHPSTMQHISYQLCQRLVSDEPPKSLVDKCVATWKRTDGDLREVVRTIVNSPEFYSPAACRSKIKSPFEYAVSSVRALGGVCDSAAAVGTAGRARQAAYLIKPPKGGGYLDLNTTSLVGQIGTMGQPLYQYQAPTGYPEDSRKWVSSGALISRLNFALALTSGGLGEVRLPDLNRTLGAGEDPNKFIDHAATVVLHGTVTPSTRQTLLKQVDMVDSPAAKMSSGRLAALLLGSPEFQRH